MGAVESHHRHLVNMTITLLRHVSLPLEFWEFIVMTAAFLDDRNPSPILGNKSPIEVLFSTPSEYLRLRTFWSKCFPCLCEYRKGKLNGKSTPYIFGVTRSPMRGKFVLIH